MKRKTKLKFIAVCLIFTFFCNMTVLAVGSSGAGAVGKFSETLSAKLAAATKDEKISAYVFFKDESESVLTTMKNSHAELFTTYTAAKGVTPAAEEKMATATDSQRLTAVDDVKLQQAIEVKRQLYKNHYTTKNAAVLEKHCEDEDVLFVSAYAPMAIVNGTVAELKALALDASVTRIDLYEDMEFVAPIEAEANRNEPLETGYIEEHWNLNSRADYTRDGLGLTGAGVKIGQLEQGLPYVEDWFLADATIITNSAYADDEWESNDYELHATNVARILVGERGIAPDATLYSACVGSTGSVYQATEWLISQGVNVINMSMSYLSGSFTDTYMYDTLCAFVDHIAIQHDVHFVAAVGNVIAGSFGNDTILVGSPAAAYNAIVVGGYDDLNSAPANDSEIYAKQKDDVLLDGSKFAETLAESQIGSINNKPHLVATGNFFWNETDISGTSFATPQVTGVIAQLCSYDSTLKTKQTSMGAILMASCGRKLAYEVQAGTEINTPGVYKGGDFLESASILGSDNQISDQQGAGKLDAYWAYTIVRDDDYWSLTLGSSTTVYEKEIYITASYDTLTRISAFWLKPNTVTNHNFVYGDNNPSVQQNPLFDWDIIVYGPNNQIVAQASTEYNNYEVVQFQAPVSGTYTIRIHRSASAANETSYIGLAVW